jgi:hypothetical protein
MMMYDGNRECFALESFEYSVLVLLAPSSHPRASGGTYLVVLK